jgi:hypothetical protein
MAAWYGDQAALFTSITSGGSDDAPHRWAFPDPRPPRNLHLNFMPFDDEPTLLTSVWNEADRVGPM